MDNKIRTITGTVTLADGTTSDFSIGTDAGWSQWGASTRRLGATVDVMEALAAALLAGNMVVSDYDEDGEDEDGEDAAPECPRCGGAWGQDATCPRCTYPDGTPRPTADPGPLGPGADEDEDEDEDDTTAGCSCGMADYGAPGHEGHPDLDGDTTDWRTAGTAREG